MRTIDLNFASVPFRNRTPYYIACAVGAALIAGSTAYNGWAYIEYAQHRAGLESDAAAGRSRIETLYDDAVRLQGLIKTKNIEEQNTRAAFTNQLIETRSFSWTELLNNLEEVQPYQVRLLSLFPRIQEKGILIESRAVAKDLRAFWNFQQNLQNHPKFRRVYPGGYLRNIEAGELIFNLAFNYFPEGAPPDVQGLPPDQFAGEGIVEAPGEEEHGALTLDERPEPEHPPATAARPQEKADQRPPGGGAVATAPAPTQQPAITPAPAADLAPAPAPVSVLPPSPPPPRPPPPAAAFGFIPPQGAAQAEPGAVPRRGPMRGPLPGSRGVVQPQETPDDGVPRVPAGGDTTSGSRDAEP